MQRCIKISGDVTLEQDLQQQLSVISRLYKESDEIYSGIANRFGLTDTSFWILYAITHMINSY